MKERKAFNFYRSHWEQISLLNDKQQLELFKAICQVQFLEKNVNDISFSDKLVVLVWTGLKHSLSTSISGFINKNKGLGEDVEPPLAKGGADALGEGGAEQGEEKGKEEEKEEEKEKKKKYDVKSDDLTEAREVLNSTCKLFDAKFYKTDKQKHNWLNTIRKLHDIDGHSYDVIKQVIIFARNDETFWRKNLLSVPTLRKKKDDIMKIDQIIAKMPSNTVKKDTYKPNYDWKKDIRE